MRSFSCPHCKAVLTLASEADFQVACPTCKAAVSPPWIPALALGDAAAVPVANVVEEAIPALVPVKGGSAAANAIPTGELLVEAEEDIPVLEEIAAPVVAKPGVDWTAFAPPEAPPTQLDAGWRAIPLGLNLVSFGSGILLVALLFFLVLAAVAALQGFQRGLDGSPQISMGTHHRTTIRAEVLIAAVGVALLAGGLLLVVGKLICCVVPRESHGRRAAVLSALALLAALGTLLANAAVHLGLVAPWPFVLELREQHPEVVAGFAAYGALIGLAFAAVEMVLFLMFLRSIGLFFADKRLPPSVVRHFKFTIFGPLLPGLFLGLAFLLVRFGPSILSAHELATIVPVVLGAVPLALFAYVIALGLWYVLLVRSARDLVLRARMGRLN